MLIQRIRQTDFKADCEESEDLQHQVMAVVVELVEFSFLAKQRRWEGLLRFAINEFSEVHGSARGHQQVLPRQGLGNLTP